ncbi:signal peptide peptidase-like 2B isoform X2 [Tachypleus tridentatus]|uniref:signal peptide peptidase-like 2B isoform X2 n=1 Tax=Tachypleus tridentatus TaxID=6853 RepID=UPI003FCF8532
MLKSVRLPNLKICTLLLILLFLYDIFFVFVTPFLTVQKPAHAQGTPTRTPTQYFSQGSR